MTRRLQIEPIDLTENRLIPLPISERHVIIQFWHFYLIQYRKNCNQFLLESKTKTFRNQSCSTGSWTEIVNEREAQHALHGQFSIVDSEISLSLAFPSHTVASFNGQVNTHLSTLNNFKIITDTREKKQRIWGYIALWWE